MKNSDYPKAILHIDGDCFFASVEIAHNPKLIGKCVITGQERGIASALSYEAKQKGVTRGMKISDIKKICPEAIIIESDYQIYSLYAKRMYQIVRKYTEKVEEYSIDECFADLTDSGENPDYEEIARLIKNDLDTQLGVNFSVGLSVTKTLAKVASKHNKPNGICFIKQKEIDYFLKDLNINKVWGIGNKTSDKLKILGIKTALDFKKTDFEKIKKYFSKPYQETWFELNGNSVLKLNQLPKTNYDSISKTKTFRPASDNYDFVFRQLSKNVEGACQKMRNYGLESDQISFFLKTQDFKFHSYEMVLKQKTAFPEIVLNDLKPHFDKIFKGKTLYRTTGITFYNLTKIKDKQLNLFENQTNQNKQQIIYRNIDKINQKFGSRTIILASSLEKNTNQNQRLSHLLKHKSKKLKLGLPFLGIAY